MAGPLMRIFAKNLEYSTRKARFGKSFFNLEVADSFRKIVVGLSEHEKLGKNEGMLFIFKKEGRYAFWMLGMKFDIDIIWLDSSGRIVYLWKNAHPCASVFSCNTVKPDKDAKYVIELNAGAASKMKIGDRFYM